MASEALDTSKPNVKHPLSFNAYQAQNNQPDDRSDAIDEDESTIDVEDEPSTAEYIEFDDVILNCRDSIVYSAYKYRLLSTTEMIEFLSRKFDCEPNTILADLSALRSKAAFCVHKERVHKKLTAVAKRKLYFKAQCEKAISDAMDSSIPFDCDKIVDLSLRYELSPKQIYDEILCYKRISTQIRRLRDQHKKLPVLRAVLKCAKLNLVY
tara:strand:+ start:1024 stop:1653 length:630 start_codon:yes stop_codon:yes gene_type:complete